MSIEKKFYTNGQLKEKGILRNGRRDGKWTYYSENGSLLREILYTDGIENGSWIMWHDNGNTYIQQNKKNGVSDGLWKEYYENGSIKEIGNYELGEYFPMDFWDEDGN